jgi:hypothetical protein
LRAARHLFLILRDMLISNISYHEWAIIAFNFAVLPGTYRMIDVSVQLRMMSATPGRQSETEEGRREGLHDIAAIIDGSTRREHI